MVALLLIVIAFPAFAGSFSAQVDKTEGTLADQFSLTLQVDGKANSKPQIPDLDDFSISAAGTSHSTSWINGEVSSKVSYRYTLTPLRIGKLKIPSLSLIVDGQRIDTLPITINVHKELHTTRNSNPAVFLERSFSTATAYVGQQVLETIKLHYRVDLREAQQEDRQLTNFVDFSLGKERKYRQTINGFTYQVIELKNSLIPLKAQSIHVPRYALRALIPATTTSNSRRNRNHFFDDMWGDFFGGSNLVRKRLITKEFNLHVLPIPKPPADSIDLAIVGEFNLTADIDKRQLNVGESATLTIEISGEGNAEGMQPIAFEVPNAKVYPDKPQIKLQKNWETGLNSRAVFKFSILPDQAGDLDLGLHNFSFFNPKEGRHTTVALAFGAIKVKQGEQEQRVVVGNSRPSVTTVMDIHRGAQLTVNHSLTAELRHRLLAIAVLILLVCAGVWLYQRFSKRKTVKRINAYRDFKRSNINDIADLDRSIRSYLCDKYKLQMSATRQEINSSLQAHELQIKLQERVDKFLRQLELILFSSQQQSSQNLTDLISEGHAIVDRLERSE